MCLLIVLSSICAVPFLFIASLTLCFFRAPNKVCSFPSTTSLRGWPTCLSVYTMAHVSLLVDLPPQGCLKRGSGLVRWVAFLSNSFVSSCIASISLI